MPQPPTEYTSFLTDIDRISVRIERNRHSVTSFSVQYEALINSRWRKIVRYDSADGFPHRHIFHADKKEYRQLMSVVDNNEALSEALTIIKKKFQVMRTNYIAQAHIDEVN